MRRIQRVEQPLLRLALDTPRSAYVCRACRLRAATTQTRSFHASHPSGVEKPWGQRLRESIFGSKDRRKPTGLQERSADEDGGMEIRVDDKGIEYQVAVPVDPTVNEEYVSAQTWHGLERVGGEQWVKERLDEGKQFEGFMPSEPVLLSHEELDKVLHHTAVELFALQQAGRSPAELCNSRDPGAAAYDATSLATFLPSDDSEPVRLNFHTDQHRATVLDAILPHRATREMDSDGFEPLSDLEAILSTTPPPVRLFSYLHIPLTHPSLTLALLRRTVQLTARRLPDRTIASLKTLSDLRRALATTPPPRKLAHDPRVQSLPAALPNVHVYTRRRGLIDREKSVGRWKVIEQELAQRGLSAQGTKFPQARVRVGET